MNSPDSLLESALQRQLITPEQHQQVLSILTTYPGTTTEQVLIRQKLLTTEQVAALKSGNPITSSGKQARLVPADNQPVKPGASISSESAPTWTPAPVQQRKWKSLEELIRLARHWKCSDLQISPGRPPSIRLNGELRYMELPPLTAEATEQICFSLLTAAQAEELREKDNLDFSLSIGQDERYRCNVFRQRLGWEGVYRIIPTEVPKLETLGLPSAAQKLMDYHQGMVLVTGPARSGKTTTLAAMVDRLNHIYPSHVITIEDPIEYLHKPDRCQISQREVGAHTESFSTALRASLREDPDVIMVGEMRDLETISIAISAAETGHLVLGTLHTSSATRTVNRILDVYPPRQRDQVAVMLSESMRGVISQLLLSRKDKSGMALAYEVLIITSGVSALIKEGKTFQLTSVIQSGRRYGMHLMDDTLGQLVQNNIVSYDEAIRFVENRAGFEKYMQPNAGGGIR